MCARAPSYCSLHRKRSPSAILDMKTSEHAHNTVTEISVHRAPGNSAQPSSVHVSSFNHKQKKATRATTEENLSMPAAVYGGCSTTQATRCSKPDCVDGCAYAHAGQTNNIRTENDHTRKTKMGCSTVPSHGLVGGYTAFTDKPVPSFVPPLPHHTAGERHQATQTARNPQTPAGVRRLPSTPNSYPAVSHRTRTLCCAMHGGGLRLRMYLSIQRAHVQFVSRSLSSATPRGPPPPSSLRSLSCRSEPGRRG